MKVQRNLLGFDIECRQGNVSGAIYLNEEGDWIANETCIKSYHTRVPFKEITSQRFLRWTNILGTGFWFFIILPPIASPRRPSNASLLLRFLDLLSAIVFCAIWVQNFAFYYLMFAFGFFQEDELQTISLRAVIWLTIGTLSRVILERYGRPVLRTVLDKEANE